MRNAQKFEAAFYSNPDLRNVRPPEEKEPEVQPQIDLMELIEQLQKSPELAQILANIVQSGHAQQKG
ncbi:MAG: hypothetical protein GX800_06440, partial [Clostridiaceae bacterium]|nr:hypothetical protein [Clostridiaceae bacterium]